MRRHGGSRQVPVESGWPTVRILMASRVSNHTLKMKQKDVHTWAICNSLAEVTREASRLMGMIAGARFSEKTPVIT